MAKKMSITEAVQKIAIAKAIGEKEFTVAKAAVPDGTVERVDVWLHVVGKVTKDNAIVSKARKEPAVCELRTGDVIGEVMRELKATPAVLRRVLRRIVKRSLKANDGKAVGPDLVGKNEDLLAVFAEVGSETAKGLPLRTIPGSSQAGAVRLVIETVEFGAKEDL